MKIADQHWPLVHAAQQGDEEAYKALIDEFNNLIRAACRRFRVSPAEQEDMQGDAYLALVLAIQHYDPQRGASFAGYAKAKTREATWQYIRVRNRNKSRELADAPTNGDDDSSRLQQLPDPASSDAFCELEWRELLASLSEREALLIERQIIDGYTMAEIARMEGVSPATVKTWKRRAYEKIHTLCQKDPVR